MDIWYVLPTPPVILDKQQDLSRFQQLQNTTNNEWTLMQISDTSENDFVKTI